jgi:superfamily II DNA or RNA helicase
VKESVAVLFDEGFDAAEYSSDIEPLSKRRMILDSFEEPSNSTRFLVAVKCLDEGVNLPIMNSAILVSSSRSTREFVQRRGRILRRHPDKPYAVIHDIVVLPFTSPEDEYPITKSELDYVKEELSRVAHFGKNALNRDEVDTGGILRILEHAYYAKD